MLSLLRNRIKWRISMKKKKLSSPPSWCLVEIRNLSSLLWLSSNGNLLEIQKTKTISFYLFELETNIVHWHRGCQIVMTNLVIRLDRSVVRSCFHRQKWPHIRKKKQQKTKFWQSPYSVLKKTGIYLRHTHTHAFV